MFTKQLYVAAYTLVDQLSHLSHHEFQKLCNFLVPKDYTLSISKKIKINVSEKSVEFKLKIITKDEKIKCIFIGKDKICSILEKI